MNELLLLKNIVSSMDKIDDKSIKFYYGTEIDINGYLNNSDGNKYPLIYLITPYSLKDGFESTGNLTFVIALRNTNYNMPNTKRAEITFPVLYEIYEDFKKHLNFNNFITINEENIERTTFFGYSIFRNEDNEAIDVWDAFKVKINNIKFNFKNNC